MVRPKKQRYVRGSPEVLYFKPRAVPLKDLEEVTLDMEEVEALRLKGKEGLNQRESAEKMNISRSTFGRILKSANRKVAEFLEEGKALKIEGGKHIVNVRTLKCNDCGHEWNIPHGETRPKKCPECGSNSLKSKHEIKSKK